MAMFSAFKRGVKQAKELKAAEQEAKKKEDVKTPYKHVPTHAATDALTSAPAWREDDRPKIFEANRRRSTMTPNNYDYLAPKSSSSLSTMSYPAENANPVVRLPRAVSYSGYPTMHASRFAWQNATDPNSVSRKGKEPERPQMSGPGRGTSLSLPTRERPGPSPLGSSSESASSGDEMEAVEMRPRVRHSMAAQKTPPISGSPISNSSRSSVEQAPPKLQPRNPRRLSDASIERGPVGILKNPSSYGRSYNGVPPVPSMPQQRMGPHSSLPSGVASSNASLSSIPSGVFSSAGVSTASTPISHSAHSSIATKASVANSYMRYAQSPTEQGSYEAISPASSESYSPTIAASTPRYTDTMMAERRVQKQTRFAEEQPQQAEAAKFNFNFVYQDTRRPEPPRLPSNAEINFAFTEPITLQPAIEMPRRQSPPPMVRAPTAPMVPVTVVSPIPQQAPVDDMDAKTSKKMSKRGGQKLLKKNRLSKAPTVAV